MTEMSVRVRGEVATRMSTQGKSVRTRLGERMCVCACAGRVRRFEQGHLSPWGV